MSMPEIPPFLELTNATVEKSGHRILNALTLTIDIGEQTAIVGPNGSGKSTLIKLLTRQLYPLEPKGCPAPVRVFGKDLWNVEELRSKMGIVSNQLQRDFLNNTRNGHIRGLEVVISGFFSSLRLFPHQKVTAAMRNKALKALDQMESGYLTGYMLDEMSTGEVQRILIARALVTEPEVLVLDEPTTGLDLVARFQCMSLVRKIAKNGTTIVLVTHHIDEIIPEIERVILLQKGEIAFNGQKKEILTDENLTRIYEHPVTLSKQDGFYQIHMK